ncbi:MAG: 6-bladed beta-propeller [Planctomycetota bacterium]|jgi:hypothetical protein
MLWNESGKPGRVLRTLTWGLVPLCVFALFVAAATAGSWSGNEVVKEGVKHVMNPKDSMEKTTTVKLKEQWRIGGEDDEEIFGVITDIIADDDGNVYMLDAQLNEIKVYSADGEYLRTIGREGEGPGEFRGAFSMMLVPGGNIGVLQTFPSKIVMLTPDGEPAGEYPLPEAEGEGFRAILAAEYAGDNIALIYVLNQPSEAGFTQNNILSLVDSKGEKETRLHSQASTMAASNAMISEKEWDTFRNRWTASPDGRAFSAVDFGEYAINVWTPDGKLDRVIHREYPEHVRTDEDKERLLDIYKGFTRQIPIPNMKYEIEETWNEIQSLQAREDGTLWVRTSRGTQGLDDGVLGIYDVFDKLGRFAKQVKVVADGDPLNDGVFIVKDRMFVVTDFLAAMMALQGGPSQSEEGEEEEEEPELMQIISYRLDG